MNTFVNPPFLTESLSHSSSVCHSNGQFLRAKLGFDNIRGTEDIFHEVEPTLITLTNCLNHMFPLQAYCTTRLYTNETWAPFDYVKIVLKSRLT